MFSSSPSIQSALDIGRQAELYSYERKFSSAFELFTSALNVLVPSIRKEPSGERRDLLQQQVTNKIKQKINKFNEVIVFINVFSTGYGLDARS